MANFTGKYFKAWKVYEKNGFKKIDLGDSTKNKDGEYENWTWFGSSIVGNAKNIEVNEGDIIEVKNGMVTQSKSGDKWYTNVTIFDFEVMKKNGNVAPKSQAQAAVDVFESDIPF